MLLAVLTISDRCSKGLQEDTAGPAVCALLRQQWPEAEIWAGLLPDDEDAIAGKLEDLSGQGAALVLTAGGTGLGPRDLQPVPHKRQDGNETFFSSALAARQVHNQRAAFQSGHSPRKPRKLIALLSLIHI